MVKKFPLFLKERIGWKLLFETALAVLVLLWLKAAAFSFWPAFIFFALMALEYFSLPEERRFARFSFVFLVGATYLSLVTVTLPFFDWFVLLLFAVLLFIVLGLGRLIFQDRFVAYGILNTGLQILFFLPVFYELKPATLFWWLLVVFFCEFWLWLECLRFFGLLEKSRRLTAAGLALVAAEISAVVMFLPLGFVNAAAFLGLLLFLARDSFLAYGRGSLNLPFVLKETTFFVFFAVLIFATARWSLY